METLDRESILKRLIPVTEWANQYSYPPLGTLRYLIFHADTNGFNKCIKRIGRRVLIDPEAYFEWIEEQNGGQGHEK